jgi:PAS domain S-box-containing protein
MPDPAVDASGSARIATGRIAHLHSWVAMLVLVVVYLGCAELSLQLAIAPGFATPVWPPSGIALAMLLVYGMRLWPGVWLAACLANAWQGAPWIATAAIATGNTLEALVAYWLVHRYVGRDLEFRRPEAAFRFAGSVALSGIVAASIGTAALALAGVLPGGGRLANWYTWWLGDMAGMIVVTPFVVAWIRESGADGVESAKGKSTELAAFAAALAAIFAIVLALSDAQSELARAAAFLLIPFVAWAGCRFSERVVTATVLTVTAIAVWATLDERRAFLFANVEAALLVMQAFVATVAVMGLALCALTRQRTEAELQLRQASERLEAAVQARTEELEQKNRELSGDLAERARLSAALARRESQLAEAQKLTHIGSWNWDVGADRVTCSDELLRIFGIEQSQFEGTFARYLERVHPQDRERVQNNVRAALISREPWQSTERIVRSDGAVRLLRTMGGIWTDAAGEVTALYGASVDVTESTRREQIQSVQHEITEVLVRAPDWPEAITESMRIVCETLDWALGQMWTVDSDRESIRYSCSWMRSDYSAFVSASKALVFGQGQGLPGRAWLKGAAEWIEDAPEDPARPRARWAAQSNLHGALCFPLTAAGRVLGVLEFFATERRRPQEELLQAVVALGSQLGEYIVRNRAERLLRESEERFRLLIEGVKEYAIVMLDPHGRVATWNSGAARINGYRADEIVGRHFKLFYTTEEREQKRPEALLAQAIEQSTVEAEGWRVRKDGSRFWANVVITVLYGTDGALRGFAKVTRDMTERKQVEALEEAGRQTRQFLAMLGHELRNPLAPIRNAVGVMRMREIDDPQIQYCRDLIERQVSQLARLVDDLLDASRITTGMIGLQPEPLDVAHIVRLAVEASRPNIDARGHVLRVETSEEPIAISGDQTRLVQVVQNLLNNAAKFTPRGGNIVLKVGLKAGMAVVEVRDDGIGIAPDMLPRIFELFMQADGSLARTEGGLGVGLTLARRIVEMHGGSVKAASAGVGHGATFTVRLPVLEQPHGRSELQSADTAGAVERSGSRSVLVVDDNQDAADSVAALLGLRGHRVRVAYDGPSGLAVAAEHSPEIVLLDIGLPGMDGYEVATRLREMPQTRSSTIVALTGYGQDEDRQRTAQARFDAHLVKPVAYDALYALIDAARAQPLPDPAVAAESSRSH